MDKVQVVLLAHEGTFASMPNLDVTDKDFSISRIKYLAPMFYMMLIGRNDISFRLGIHTYYNSSRPAQLPRFRHMQVLKYPMHIFG